VSAFIEALGQFQFLRLALLAGVLSSIACGVVGTYVVARRITYLAGGIAHCVLGGIGMARWARAVYGWEWLHPLHGAIVAALLAAAIIGLVSLRARQREDTAISALYAVGMALGVLFLLKTPGYAGDLQSYLFGNILMVAEHQIWLIACLDVLVVLLGLAFYHQFLAVCFDEEFARLRGVAVEPYYLLLLGLTALTVVVLSSVVGIVLVIALLTLPVAITEHFCRSLWQMMAGAALLSCLFTVAGLVLSYESDLPAGPTIILLAGAAYLLMAVGRYVVSHAGGAGRRAIRVSR
jgi:zinc transport system permease protein